MDLGIETLAKTITFSKYAKYLPEVGRREVWDDIVDRYELMLIKKYPDLKTDIESNIGYIRERKVLPSMRALQFAGLAMEVNNARGYNCAYLPIDSYHAFSETMFLLLGGSGVGYSVQKHHVAQLPAITKPTKTRRFLIGDDIMGWADAIKALMKAYLCGKAKPLFDGRGIRKKGSPLMTAGGKAPGYEPLKLCLAHIEAILERKEEGEFLTPLECHDILCHIANAVLAGGIRRSAMIALFSMDDEEMITCKFGNYWELNEQRGRANNSAMLLRGKVTKEQFYELWSRIQASGTGEPGIYWTNDLEWGTNPCCEVALRAFQFCNLCEINVNNIESQSDLNARARVAAFFGTLQAGFTDFHYLRPIWRKTTEKDALVGVGQTGIASGKVLGLDLTKAAEIVVENNKFWAAIIGINAAARSTLVKPSGTTSCLLGCSSGIHGWHDWFFLRTVRFGLDEEIAQYFLKYYPQLCELDVLRPHDTLCVRIPIKAPTGSILRYEGALPLLERVKKYSQEWIRPGHTSGANTHNVSATIYIDGEQEWETVGEWMWDNKEFYNGLSVLPYDGGNYKQAPFETITEDEYKERMAGLSDLDLSQVYESEDNVNFGAIAACSGGSCSTE